ncbi:LacI family DNA-binding transcriptional regulator [Ruegeria conchae]|uniref:LacI family DNA-binding transcriptional regulator n=1 Tax=Ruegeria conchae TaxID=981384 RepID=UPI0021A482B1|nr:LacI family DNA-binding transcriptional regulator [Ruegeria conchae]
MARKNSVTSVDVAKRAGVSQSAVSRAFSRVPTQSGVSAEAKERIFAAAKELGYRPNALARSMITGNSKIIALLFSYLDNQFYAVALEKLCIELQKNGYHAMVFMMPETAVGVEETVSELLEYKVDGIITASVELSSSLCKLCQDQGISVVMFNRIKAEEGVSCVSTDNVLGGRLAARHLIETGHQKIALLSGWAESSTGRDRQLGFERELSDQGHSLFDHAAGHFDLAATRTAARNLLDRPASERPDGIFVANDYMAIEALGVIRSELKLKVPQDVSIVGFDDIPMAASPEYDLTTLRQPINKMIDQSVSLMLAEIAGNDTVMNESIVPELVERGSVANRT